MTTADAGKVLELVVFKLKDGVTREEWLAAVEPAAKWAEEQPGYISGDLFYDAAADRWIDVVYFASAELAEVHMKKAPNEPVNAAMFSLIDLDTPQVHYAQLAKSYSDRVAAQ